MRLLGSYDRFGSSTDYLTASLFRPLFPEKADAGADIPACQLSAINRLPHNAPFSSAFSEESRPYPAASHARQSRRALSVPAGRARVIAPPAAPPEPIPPRLRGRELVHRHLDRRLIVGRSQAESRLGLVEGVCDTTVRAIHRRP